MFKPTRVQIQTFLHLVPYITQLPESYKEKEDGLYKWLASFCRSFDKKSKLSVEQLRVLCEMPVIDLVKLMNE
jgi:hypothetical protein